MAGLNLHFRPFINPHDSPEELQRVSSLISETQSIDPATTLNFKRRFEQNGSFEETERPSKRLRTEKGDPPVDILSFRLLSSDSSPRVLLLQKPLRTIRPKSPEIEDTTLQRRQRRMQAKEAAVDMKTIMAEPYRQKPVLTTIDTYTAKSPLMYPVVLLTAGDGNPSPPAGPPRLVVTKDDAPSIKKKRRRFKPKPIQPRPTFWRPTLDMGLKATGYALGYEGSWATEDPSKVGYIRDKMKKKRDPSLMRHRTMNRQFQRPQ